jgi:methylated-DNA-[protein]-cysteine S-methyltransferase
MKDQTVPNQTVQEAAAHPGAPTLKRTTISTPVGELTLIASPTGLRTVLWCVDGKAGRLPVVASVDASVVDDDDPILAQARRELAEYFAGDRQEFSVALEPMGTSFQQSAWKVLRDIPFGETINYGEQARRLGDVKKSRAVGAANGRNPLSIIVPCHRVVGADGSLTGFGGGIENKAWLLDHERMVRYQVS